MVRPKSGDICWCGRLVLAVKAEGGDVHHVFPIRVSCNSLHICELHCIRDASIMHSTVLLLHGNPVPGCY
jgi:hypothetical protein